MGGKFDNRMASPSRASRQQRRTAASRSVELFEVDPARWAELFGDLPQSELPEEEKLATIMYWQANNADVTEEVLIDPFGHAPRGISRRAVQRAVSALRAKGVLVPVTSEPALLAYHSRRICEQLSAIMGDVYCALDGDVSATDALPGMEEIRARIDELARSLAARRRASLRAQLAELGVGAQSRGLRLFVGGEKVYKSWIRIGFPPADLAMDLRWGLPFGEDSVELAYEAHVLEHLEYRDETSAHLRDLHRVLEPGGTVRIVVPDIGVFMSEYARGNSEFFEARRQWSAAFGPILPTMTPLDQILDYVGSGIRHRAAAGFFQHKSGFDFVTLKEQLACTGFVDIVERAVGESPHPDFCELDELSDWASLEFAGVGNSLFVEARKGDS